LKKPLKNIKINEHIESHDNGKINAKRYGIYSLCKM